MANLSSPGIQVKIIDESFYTPAAPGSTPLIFVASAENKANAAATGLATGTLKANAGAVYVITSQRDLTNTFGTPTFQSDNSGNSIHGDERNEYGLQSAYSLLGISSRAYVVRADLDLAQLKPTSVAPTGVPESGSYWINPAQSKFGINVWSTLTNQFTLVTPLIINDENMATALNTGATAPATSFGQKGDYAVVVTSDNGWATINNSVFYKNVSNNWILVAGGFDGGKQVKISPHTDYPDFTSATGSAAISGSIWIKTTTPGNGSSWNVKYYNGATKQWSTKLAPVYTSTKDALYAYDSAGGGKNIATGTLFVEADPHHYGITTATNASASFLVWRYNGSGTTSIISDASTYTTSTQSTFTIRQTTAGSKTWGGTVTVNISGDPVNPVAAGVPAALSAAGLTNIVASFDVTTNRLTITHRNGGDFEIKSSTAAILSNLGFNAYSYNPTTMTASGTTNLYTAPLLDDFEFIASSWMPLMYDATTTTPSTAPAEGTLWFDSDIQSVDIMYHNGTTWIGYGTAFPTTNPNGPIISATEPLKTGGHSDGGNLVTGDIWISTANADMYGHNIYVWDNVANEWVKQDPTDQHSTNGWVFADARWSDAGANSEPATIKTLLTSGYLDPDAPDPALYPRGTRLWNTRRSGNNVKQYHSAYVDKMGTNPRMSNASMSGYFADRWVSVHNVNEDGSGIFGRYSQRAQVVQAFKALINTNNAIRDTETLRFNLIACPGYTEAIANMVNFNTDIGQTAFVVGDTPFRLVPTGTALSAWANNSNNALDNGDVGTVTSDSYLALFYPSGYTSDNTGKNIVVPPSHMMLNTIVNSDSLSYEWFAPAGLRRGGIINASSVGYINDMGEFQKVSLYQGLRDVCSQVKLNPLATMTGVGTINMGQYTRAAAASSLDRINVARLVAYLRRQLSVLSKPYLFEPNDTQTRNEIRGAVESLLLELVGQRALNDFVVVCDTTNNTPARIDRSELYVDIAIEPVKAVEFIYIPLRLLNTGSIASGDLGAGFPGSTN